MKINVPYFRIVHMIPYLYNISIKHSHVLYFLYDLPQSHKVRLSRSMSEALRRLCCAQSLSHVRLFATLWTVPARLLGPWGFSSQENWNGLPCPLPGDLPNLGVKPRSPALQADALPSEPPEKPTEKANLILFTYCAIKSEIKSFIYSFILLILLQVLESMFSKDLKKKLTQKY